jgi:FemAB-related protein (PEP-CTERM system-associated)
MTVREIECEESSIWSSFVESHPLATAFHLYGWKTAIERAYRLVAPYLGVFEEARLVAILPTVIIQFPFRRPYAVSLPFCNYAGLLVAPGSDRALIEQELLSHLGAYGVASVELRELSESQASESTEVTLRLSLPDSSDLLWKQFDPKVRNLVRKAEKAGLVARRGIDLLCDFYEIYARNMAHLGTPVHARRFFEELAVQLKGSVDVLTVTREGRAIAAMLLLKFRKQLSDPWASSLRQFDSLSPNMLMYWEALRHACDIGMREFDFGRSEPDSGTFRFKAQWGAETCPLHYEVVSLDGKHHAVSTELYAGRSSRLATQIWQRLPFWATLWLGPKVRKHLP